MWDASDDPLALGNPGWFLHGLDADSRRATFVRTDRAALSAEPFLDHRWRQDELACREVAVSDFSAVGSEPAPVNFIWHTSHCASTVLASCLDAEGRCLALKEPQVLVILAALKRGGLRDPALARAVFALLARRFQPGEQVLIKPSNSANNLITEAAALTKGRMLLLYSDCESFVLSIARQGVSGFGLVRRLFMSLARDGHPAGCWPPEQLFRLTDLQLAVLVWRMQMDALEVAATRLGERARSLDCRRFLTDPGPVLCAVDDFLGLGIGEAHIQGALDGPRFRGHAKLPGQVFDPEARAAENRRLRAQLGRDLDEALSSIERDFPLAPPLEVGPAMVQ